MDMTSIWVAEQGWRYLNAIIDCCTRELVGWSLDVRCRAQEAITVLEGALATSCFVPDELQVGDEAERLTLGTDNGSAFTSRAFKAVLAEHDVGHRRGGYRDPESQAFIESWFAKLKEREVWLRVRDPRRRPTSDRALRRPLPPPPAQRARLPDASGGASGLGGSAENRGLRCQLWKGAGHTPPPRPSRL
jgi:transposase InsO family protein